MADRVAVVSGGNRGLGLEIVEQLARRGLRVVLASRSHTKGAAAAAQLARNIVVHPLDIADADSVTEFARWLSRSLRRCDVLVNNAAIAIDGPMDAATGCLETVRMTLETNLLGSWRLTQALVPAMRARRYGRIVNVSSGVGSLSQMGAGIPAYRLSKLALNGLTRILAEELRHDGILVNACCPGWVRTDMGGPSATRTVADAADTPVWLATLDDTGPTGGFYRDRELLAW